MVKPHSKEHLRKCKEVYDWNNSCSEQMTYLERLQYCRRFYVNGIEVMRYKPTLVLLDNPKS